MTTQVTSVPSSRPSVGNLVREWRQRRHLSQLDLAVDAEISTRHLSFIETGRSIPSREMVLHLSERLDIPLRTRNVLLVAAGHAPVFPERPLVDPALKAARAAVDLVLAGHEPCPALAVDRHWTMVAANRAVAPMLTGVDPTLLQPPVNALRVGLHPQGMGPRIINYAEWRSHILMRLRRQIEASADAVLAELLRELSTYPAPDDDESGGTADEYAGVVVPLKLRTEHGVLAFVSTITVFGTPVDITLSELALETFFPADEATARAIGAGRV
jgi:transcriptional regulator with XRE-family HTH domain